MIVLRFFAAAILALAACLPLVAALPAVSPPLVGHLVLGSDWPYYGHDLSNTRDAGFQGINPLNVRTLVPLWSVDPGGDVTGTPAVVNGIVYVGTYNGFVGAYKLADGTQIWRVNPTGFDISSSVAVANGHVFFTDHGAHIGSLDAATGTTEWLTDLSFGYVNVQLYGSPVPVGHDIITGVSSYQETDPTVAGFQGSVVKLNETTGAVEWRTDTLTCATCTGGAVWSTPAVDPSDGMVFIGTGNAYTTPADNHTDSMMALSLADGHVIWSHQFFSNDIWTQPTGGPGPDADFGASPNLFHLGSRLVVGEGEKDGTYHVVDALTGTSIWDNLVAQGSSLGGFLSSTAVHGGRIYGGLVNVGGALNISSPTNPSLGLQGSGPTDVNALPTGAKVLALDTATGAVSWQYPAIPTLSAMAYSNGVIFEGDLSGTVHAYSATTGLPLWVYPTGEPIESGPVVAEGVVVVATGSGLGVPTGHHIDAFVPVVGALR
ncbi:MAG: outer membrane protein assembly factor BamB family protein [Thermoplasmatota archaeon]